MERCVVIDAMPRITKGRDSMIQNYVQEVAEIFGQTIGVPFKVIGEDGGKALVKFDAWAGLKRFDGTNWNDAGYMLEYMIIGKIKLYMEQGTLF